MSIDDDILLLPGRVLPRASRSKSCKVVVVIVVVVLVVGPRLENLLEFKLNIAQVITMKSNAAAAVVDAAVVAVAVAAAEEEEGTVSKRLISSLQHLISALTTRRAV